MKKIGYIIFAVAVTAISILVLKPEYRKEKQTESQVSVNNVSEDAKPWPTSDSRFSGKPIAPNRSERMVPANQKRTAISDDPDADTRDSRHFRMRDPVQTPVAEFEKQSPQNDADADTRNSGHFRMRDPVRAPVAESEEQSSEDRAWLNMGDDETFPIPELPDQDEWGGFLEGTSEDTSEDDPWKSGNSDLNGWNDQSVSSTSP
jgi:hypothetical protein